MRWKSHSMRSQGKESRNRIRSNPIDSSLKTRPPVGIPIYTNALPIPITGPPRPLQRIPYMWPIDQLRSPGSHGRRLLTTASDFKGPGPFSTCTYATESGRGNATCSRDEHSGLCFCPTPQAMTLCVYHIMLPWRELFGIFRHLSNSSHLSYLSIN
ncbi:hypothetical protein FVEG_14970 [Fusarium verticillioides 7600]|uniref:Uncharacterized protein n=1 Tax=Gibberella moniliformis (strain M3125 / FGSC 7600) TaxID=334819 RepID=W7LI05_GIBM7|nr:hypothetical protein FVEG_14970 [Fusarium verticillioides 7600]EWG39008.1 hypothetical protein FVEG_14970 [Fusarium verticillioides 7600]